MSEAPRDSIEREMFATVTPQSAPAPATVLDAAARANALRLQRRALEAAAQGQRDEAVRLLRAVAARLRELGEPELAAIAQQESDELARTGQTTRMGAKELIYSTRRLGRR
jgi:hypothetical protein